MLRNLPHRRLFLSEVLLLTLCMPARVFCQTAPEASHRERFEPHAKALERAESDLTAKLATNANDAASLSSRGLLRLQMNHNSAALEDLRAAVLMAPNIAQFHINLAYGQLVTQNLPQGAAEARKALALEEKNYAAHGLLGRALLAEGSDTREAIRHLQRSLELNPDQADLRFELVQAFRKEKDFPAAGVQLRVLKDQLPPDDVRLEYAQGLLSADMGYPEAAVRSFRRALEIRPSFLAVRQDLGAALVRMERWQEAASVLGPLAEARPDSYLAAYLYALALQNSRHPKEAEGEVRRALQLQENSADAQTLLGITLSAQNRLDEAIAALSRAAELDPNSFDAQLYLGRARYARSDAAGAAAALEKAVQLRPNNPEARFLLGTVDEVSGQQEAAIEQYRELQRTNPNDPRGYLGLGGFLGKLGKNEVALAQLRRATELNPENFETNMALGRLLAKTGDFGESIRYLRQAAKESPDSPEVHYQLGLSLQRAGRKAEALKEFAEVDRLNRARRIAPGMAMDTPRP
jgi:tetratricopeptide (TPR) repeat protein